MRKLRNQLGLSAILCLLPLWVAATPEQLRPPRGRNQIGFTLTSSSFKHEGVIPSQYTCEGKNISPPLSFTGLPAGTQSLALIVDDPDAPDPKAPKMTWVHWVLYNIPPSVGGFPEALQHLPSGTQQGVSSWKRPGYGGPCPPIGRHRYFHKLYALDTVLADLGQPDAAKLQHAMAGHILAKTELIGTYQKQQPAKK